MEEDCWKVNSQTVDRNELGSCKGANSHNEASGVGISEDLGYSTYNMRRSSRLASKKRETSCARDIFVSDGNGFKCKMESPKTSYDQNNLVFGSKVGVGNMLQVLQRNVNGGVISAETAFSSSMKSFTSVPSFEFHVRSEEGIKLFVDLNSSQSDWSKSIENGACVCQNYQKTKYQSFRQELEYLGNSNDLMRSLLLRNSASESGMNNGHVQTVSSPNLMKRENVNEGFDKPHGGYGTLGFSVTKPCSVGIEVSVDSGVEKEVPLLSTSIISSSESCLGVGDTTNMDSIVPDAPQAKSSSVVNLALDGSEKSPTDVEQNFKLGSENCGNTALQDNCSLKNPIAEYPGCTTIGSKEIQLADVASHQKYSSCSGNLCSQNLVNTVDNAKAANGRLANTIEFNQDTCGNHTLAIVKERERVKSANGIEVSNQLENKLRKSVPDGRCKRKGHDCGSHDKSGRQDGRILRSATHLGVQGFRRSTRLVSK